MSIQALDLLAQGPLADNEVQIRAVSALASDQQIECARRINAGDFETVRDWRVAVGDAPSGKEPATRGDAWEAKAYSIWGQGNKTWKRSFVRSMETDLRSLLDELDAERQTDAV